MQAPTHDTLRLGPGETRLITVHAGSLLLVEDGSVDVTGPARWLGDAMHHETQRLGAGTCHPLPAGGWIRVKALRSCELRLWNEEMECAKESAGAHLLRRAARALRAALTGLRHLAGPGKAG